VAIGCFREAQLQGLLLGDEPGKTSGMSRPNGDSRCADLVAPKLPVGPEPRHAKKAPWRRTVADTVIRELRTSIFR